MSLRRMCQARLAVKTLQLDPSCVLDVPGRIAEPILSIRCGGLGCGWVDYSASDSGGFVMLPRCG